MWVTHWLRWVELTSSVLNNKLIAMKGNYAAAKSIISLTVHHLPFKNILAQQIVNRKWLIIEIAMIWRTDPIILFVVLTAEIHFALCKMMEKLLAKCSSWQTPWHRSNKFGASGGNIFQIKKKSAYSFNCNAQHALQTGKHQLAIENIREQSHDIWYGLCAIV